MTVLSENWQELCPAKESDEEMEDEVKAGEKEGSQSDSDTDQRPFKSLVALAELPKVDGCSSDS